MIPFLEGLRPTLHVSHRGGAALAPENTLPAFEQAVRRWGTQMLELDVQPSKPLIERNERRGGVSVRMENVIVANLNGGGPVIRIKTLNGGIRIAKTGG